MDRLNAVYARFLGFGMVSLREALASKDFEWAEAEVELLHNVPSLTAESNSKRHRYFFNVERQHYLQWAQASGREVVQRRVRMYYEPLWRDMEPIILKLVSDQLAVASVPIEGGSEADSGVILG